MMWWMGIGAVLAVGMVVGAGVVVWLLDRAATQHIRNRL
jgi:hypothetical protein